MQWSLPHDPRTTPPLSVKNPLHKWGEKWAYFQAKIKLGPRCMEMMGLWEKRNETKPRKYIHSKVAGWDGPGVLGVACSLVLNTWQHMASYQWMDGWMDEQIWDLYTSNGLVSITLLFTQFLFKNQINLLGQIFTKGLKGQVWADGTHPWICTAYRVHPSCSSNSFPNVIWSLELSMTK